MHGLCGMGQMMFTKYIVVVNDDATKKLSGEGFKRPWPPLIKWTKR